MVQLRNQNNKQTVIPHIIKSQGNNGEINKERKRKKCGKKSKHNILRNLTEENRHKNNARKECQQLKSLEQ